MGISGNEIEYVLMIVDSDVRCIDFTTLVSLLLRMFENFSNKKNIHVAIKFETPVKIDQYLEKILIIQVVQTEIENSSGEIQTETLLNTFKCFRTRQLYQIISKKLTTILCKHIKSIKKNGKYFNSFSLASSL